MCCILAFLLATLARKTARHAELDLSLPALLDELSAIREVAAINPQGTLAHPKDRVTLSRIARTQRKLADVLDIANALRRQYNRTVTIPVFPIPYLPHGKIVRKLRQAYALVRQ
ncbi:MAG: hypothetical protein NTU83_07330 [Candidatus Hydrogenedentes bacterium]|nr:hypothetical protein [Candidatus Hydrogenedentota bacterium]